MISNENLAHLKKKKIIIIMIIKIFDFARLFITTFEKFCQNFENLLLLNTLLNYINICVIKWTIKIKLMGCMKIFPLYFNMWQMKLFDVRNLIFTYYINNLKVYSFLWKMS